MADRAVRQDLSEAGFNADLILANVRKLRALVGSLSWEEGEQGWSTYVECSHVTRDRAEKSEFLDRALQRFAPRRVVDLGANDGHFSRIAAGSGALAIAIDSDEPVLDEVYRGGVGSGLAVALTDLANPVSFPGLGGPRKSLADGEARPDLIIAYGVIHHLIYGASIRPRGRAMAVHSAAP